MKIPGNFYKIEKDFNEEDRVIMWLIREFRRRYQRKYPNQKRGSAILSWFVYQGHDPRIEKSWKIAKRAFHKLKEEKIDVDKYLTYIFGHERDVKFYFLGSSNYIKSYKEHQKKEIPTMENFLEGEKQMIEKLIKARKFNDELELFQNVPAIMFSLSQEYLLQSDAYKALKEEEWFDLRHVKDPLLELNKEKNIKNILRQ